MHVSVTLLTGLQASTQLSVACSFTALQATYGKLGGTWKRDWFSPLRLTLGDIRGESTSAFHVVDVATG